MRTTLNHHTDLKETVRQVLPYKFRILPTGKIMILKTTGQNLIVSRGEVDHILQRQDLDVHRRRMYEAALDVWEKNEVKQ
jgi:hypothetical protein